MRSGLFFQAQRLCAIVQHFGAVGDEYKRFAFEVFYDVSDDGALGVGIERGGGFVEEIYACGAE